VSDEPCVICRDQPAHEAYGCVECLARARRLLGEIGDMAGAALDVAHRQAVRGTGGGASSKPGSQEPINRPALARLDAIQNALTTVARDIAETRGVEIPRAPAVRPVSGPTCARPYSCDHGSCRDAREPLRSISEIEWTARWLTTQCEWVRHRPAVARFVSEIEACARVIRGIAEPGGQHRVIVGMCDCGKTLYAPAGRQVVTCKDCELTWAVNESRDALRGHLDQQLVTAAEAAHLAGFLDTDRSAVQIRKLVNKWAERGQLAKHGDIRIKHQHRDTCPADCTKTADSIDTYRFGEIAERIAATPRRAQAAGMGA
jgi:hypothetical protein